MMDRIDRARRSANMRRIKSTDTLPEMIVRKTAHSLGLRFRLHRKNMPGKPDLLFPGHRLAILVHGCFWHRHYGCKNCTNPKTRAAFWKAKFAANVARDASVTAQLKHLGWRVEVIWECETIDIPTLSRKLRSFVAISEKH